MQILGSSPTYLQSAISSGLDSVVQGIVQTAKQDGMSFLNTAIDTFSFAQPGTQSLFDTNAPVSAPADYPDPISFLGNEGGSGEVLSVLNQPQFRPATELGGFSTQLAKFTTELPKRESEQQLQALNSMQTTVDRITGLQQSFEMQFQNAQLSGPPMFNPGKVQEAPFWSSQLKKADPVLDRPNLEAIGNTLFFRDGKDASEIDMNDVQRGYYGSHFESRLAAFARQNPNQIKNMIQENADGTYTVTFHQRVSDDPLTYKNRTATVTNDFKGQDPRKELWPLVIEKAWNQTQLDPAYSHKWIDPLEALTGRPIATKSNPGPTGFDLANNPKYPAWLDFNQMKKDLSAGKVICITHLPKGDKYGSTRAVSNLYTDKAGKQWIELYSPGETPRSYPFEEMMAAYTVTTS